MIEHDEDGYSTPKWTPGPWTYAPIPGYQYVVEIEKASQIFLCAGHVPPGREQEIKANAQLAAAAPDLYAALKQLMDSEEGGEASPAFYRARQIAHAALAKARGEQTDAQ